MAQEPGAVVAEITADSRHDARLATEQAEVVGDVARAPAELATQFRNQEGNIQDVNLVGKDMLLEATLEHHDVVVGN